MSHLLLFAIVILSAVSTLFAQTTYYVSSSQGNNSNNGTSQSTPWKTLAKVNSTILNPGDKVLLKRGDTWLGEQLLVSRSGNQTNIILFGSYATGNKPVLSGNNSLGTVINVASGIQYLKFENLRIINNNAANVITWNAALIKLSQRCQKIEITNCEFNNWGGTFHIDARKGGLIVMHDPAYVTVSNCDFTGTMYGIFVVSNFNRSHNDAHHLTFTNNYFHRMDSYTPTAGSNPNNMTVGNLRGIAIEFKHWFEISNLLGDSPPGNIFGQEGTMRDILINGNVIDSAGFGFEWYRHPDFINQNIKGYNWTVTNNTFNLVEAEAIGLTAIGWRGGMANRSVFSGNVIDSSGYRFVNRVYGTVHGMNAIQTHAWDNCIIEYNIVSNSGTAKTGDGAGIEMDVDIADGGVNPPGVVPEHWCDSVIIRNNIFYKMINTTPAGQFLGKGIGLKAAQNCEIYNNVVYDSQVGIYGAKDRRAANNKIMFNTIFNCRDGIRAAGQKNVVVKNNIVVWGERGLYTGGTDDGSDYDYNLTFGNTIYNSGGWTTGTHDIIANPLFTDTTSNNFTLQLNSPAKDAATPVTLLLNGHQYDILGNLRVNPDMGAYEYTSGGSTPSIDSVFTSLLTQTSVTLNAEINTGNQSTTIRFQWDTDNNAVWANNQLANNSPLTSDGLATRGLTGLTPNTTYYYRAYVNNASGSDTSVVKSFTTASGTSNDILTAYPLTFNDDGYLSSSSSGTYRNSEYSNMGNISGYRNALIRFPNVSTVAGKTIDSAFVYFTAYGNSGSSGVNIKIAANDTANAQTISSNRSVELGKVLTTAIVNWNSIPTWQDGIVYKSPDLKTIIQEWADIPNHNGTGDALLLFFNNNSSSTNSRRVFSQWDYTPSGGVQGQEKPKLVIYYYSTGLPKITNKNETEILPEKYELYQNYPNPFNPSTTIKFNLPEAGSVRLDIFNIIGENVTTLINREMAAGFHSITFDAENLPSGIYIYRLQTKNFSQAKKMLLVK